MTTRRALAAGATCLALLVAVAACSDDDAGGDVATTTSGTTSGSTGAPSTTADVDSTGVASTAGPPTTSRAGSTELPPLAGEQQKASMQRVLDELPEGWTGRLVDELADEPDPPGVFEACAQEGDVMPGTADSVSSAAWKAVLDGPEGAAGSVEARQFVDQETADRMVSTMQRLLGTDAGHACLAEQLPVVLGDSAGLEEVQVDTVPTPVTGSQVGVRFVVSYTREGTPGVLSIDMLGHDLGDAAVQYASFVVPESSVDPAVLSQIYASSLS